MIDFTRRRVLVDVVVASAATTFGFVTLASAGEKLPQDNRIDIQNFKFVPESVRVKPGDTITWVNHDIIPHTATANDKSWDTGTIEKGETASLLVTDNMSSAYSCLFHPVMKATLNPIMEE